MRDVIEEDHPQSDAAEQIEPQIALDGARDGLRFLIDHGLIHFVYVRQPRPDVARLKPRKRPTPHTVNSLKKSPAHDIPAD